MNRPPLPLDRKRTCYVLAVVLPALATALIAHLPWAFGQGPFLLPLVAPVIIVALYGGLGPGLLATTVSAAGACWVMPPVNSLAIATSLDLFRLALLTGNNLLVTVLAERFLRSKAAQAAAHAEAVESRQRFEAMFQQAAVGMSLLATDGCCLRANQKLCELLGYGEAELLGTTLQDFTYPDDLAAVQEQRRRLLAHASDSYSIEQRCICRDGSVRWVNVTVSLIRQAIGMPENVLTVVEDISARKQADAALKMALDAANDANSANQAKSIFLANMSHEIRTPISAILSATQMLRRDGATAKFGEKLSEKFSKTFDELLDAQQAAGDHLLAIINDILDLSRIEAGKLELAESEVLLSRVINNTTRMLQDRLRAKGLQLTVDIPTPLPALIGDEARLQQALLNYLSNAVKFTEQGTITLRAFFVQDNIEHENADSVLIRFEVKDTGIGIEHAVLERLFTPFEQADSSTMRKFGGTGLGLAITKRLAHLMDGETGVQSTPSVGSTFWFTARLRKHTHAEIAAPAPAEDADAETILRRDFAGRKVLIAEDDPFLQEFAVILVKSVGLVADVAGNGLDAIERAAGTHYDLILMDMQMPLMDGLEATRRLRQMDNYAQAPIIAVTANVFEEDRHNIFAAGVSDFLGKPVAPHALFSIMSKWLALNRD